MALERIDGSFAAGAKKTELGVRAIRGIGIEGAQGLLGQLCH